MLLIFFDGLKAENELLKGQFDIILLDLMLPKRDGGQICTALRAAGISTPILVLTAKDTLPDKLEVFEKGADDFVPKPFSFEELLARVKALTCRAGVKDTTLKIKDVTLDPVKHKVYRGEVEIGLTYAEFKILELLIQAGGEVKSREEIFEHLWNRKDVDFGNVVDVHIRNIRKKLDDDYDQKIIRTVRRLGYAIEK